MARESNRTTGILGDWEDWPAIKRPLKLTAARESGMHEENGAESVKEPQIEIEIRPSGKPGATKAYADVRLNFRDGELRIIGFGIIKQPGKAPWIGFPENHGQNKYFPIVTAKGRIRDAIIKAILRAYEKSNAIS
jgi:hypothetical protein